MTLAFPLETVSEGNQGLIKKAVHDKRMPANKYRRNDRDLENHHFATHK